MLGVEVEPAAVIEPAVDWASRTSLGVSLWIMAEAFCFVLFFISIYT